MLLFLFLIIYFQTVVIFANLPHSGTREALPSSHIACPFFSWLTVFSTFNLNMSRPTLFISSAFSFINPDHLVFLLCCFHLALTLSDLVINLRQLSAMLDLIRCILLFFRSFIHFSGAVLFMKAFYILTLGLQPCFPCVVCCSSRMVVNFSELRSSFISVMVISVMVSVIRGFFMGSLLWHMVCLAAASIAALRCAIQHLIFGTLAR